MTDRIIAGIPWAIGSFLGPRAITFATTIVLARMVSPADFGLFAIGLLFFMATTTLVELGLSSALISMNSVEPETERAALGLVLLGSAVAVTFLGIGCAFTAAYGELAPAATVATFAIAVPAAAFGTVHVSLLQRELRFRSRFVVQNVQAAAMPLVGIPIAVAGGGVWALVAGHVVGTFLFASVGRAYSRRIRPTVDIGRSRSLLGEGVGFLVAEGAAFLKANVDYIAVGRWQGTSQLGFYSMAWRFAELPYLAVVEPVSRVLFASMSHLREAETDFRSTYLALLRLVGMIGCPIGIVLVFAADPFVALILGSTWQSAAGVLTILGARSVLVPLTGMVIWLLGGAGLSRKVARLYGALLGPFAVAVALAAIFGDIQTVAYVLVVDAVIWAILLVVLSARWKVLSVRDHLSALIPLSAATAGGAASAAFVRHLTHDSANVVQLAAVSAATAAAFLLISMLVDWRGLTAAVRLLRGARASRGATDAR